MQKYHNRTDKKARYRPPKPDKKPLGEPTVTKLNREARAKHPSVRGRHPSVQERRALPDVLPGASAATAVGWLGSFDGYPAYSRSIGRDRIRSGSERGRPQRLWLKLRDGMEDRSGD